MANMLDVAAYIVRRFDGVSHMKLHKLLYYSQAWSLVWDERKLFDERIEAWVNGPVIPALYSRLKGLYGVFPEHLTAGNPANLTEAERETVELVLNFYGNKSPQWLSDLTHAEEPWREARAGLAPGVRSNAEISLASMAEYYSRL